MSSVEGLIGQDLLHLRSAINEAAIVAITDKAGVITYANEKFCAISKFSLPELLGKTHQVINSGTHSRAFFVDMWSTIASGRVWEGEIRNRAKDGTYYWVHTTIVPFMDSSGRPEKYVAVRYDITERKLVEEQLSVYARRLEKSNKELEDFASVAAHDLQEPLRKIQSFADRLVTRARDTLNSDARDYIDRMQSSAQRMQILINDLLTYSRVTTKAAPFAAVALSRVVRDVISDLEHRLENGNAKITVGELPEIEADATQIRQLLQNLIGNALKFSRPGVQPEVRVEATLLPEANLGRSGSALEIRVIDNGIGFDEKYLDRIFTIFQRLHGRNEYEGTGIGLAVCQKIVDRHGGSITAKSKVGSGSTFTVILPVHQIQGETL